MVIWLTIMISTLQFLSYRQAYNIILNMFQVDTFNTNSLSSKSSLYYDASRLNDISDLIKSVTQHNLAHTTGICLLNVNIVLLIVTLLLYLCVYLACLFHIMRHIISKHCSYYQLLQPGDKCRRQPPTLLMFPLQISTASQVQV